VLQQAQQARALVEHHINPLSTTLWELAIIIPMLVCMLQQEQMVQQELQVQTVPQAQQEVLGQPREQLLDLEEQVELQVLEVDWF
jgi:hypothetical protein